MITAAFNQNQITSMGDIDARVSYNEIINKLTKITSHPYKFLKKTYKGRMTRYKINYPYWFEYIFTNKKFFGWDDKASQRTKNLNYNHKKLVKMLKKFLDEEIIYRRRRVSLLGMMHEFIVVYHNRDIKTMSLKDMKIIKDFDDFDKLIKEAKKHKFNRDEHTWHSFFRYARSYCQNKLRLLYQ